MLLCTVCISDMKQHGVRYFPKWHAECAQCKVLVSTKNQRAIGLPKVLMLLGRRGQRSAFACVCGGAGDDNALDPRVVFAYVLIQLGEE